VSAQDGDGLDEGRVRQRVRSIVGELAPAPRAASGRELLVADLGYDSLTVFELLAALEAEFGVAPLPDDDVAEIETVAEAEDAVLEQLARSRAAEQA